MTEPRAVKTGQHSDRSQMVTEMKNSRCEISWTVGIIGLCLIACSAQAQTSTVTGMVLEDRGVPIAGASVQLIQVTGQMLPPFAPHLAISDSTGHFTITKLNPGLYRACATLLGSTLLNPCEWFRDPPAVIVQAGQTVDNFKIRMAHGKFLNIRLDDAQSNLKAPTKAGDAPLVSVSAISPMGRHVVPKVAEDAKGQNHLISVPVGMKLQIDVASATLSVKGQGEAGNVNVSEGSPSTGGAASTPQTFQVGGRENNREYRFVLKGK